MWPDDFKFIEWISINSGESIYSVNIKMKI